MAQDTVCILGGGEDSCISFIRKSLNDNNRIKFMAALNAIILEYYSDDLTYLPYAMLQNNNIRTVANSLFQKFLKSDGPINNPEDFMESLRKLFMNLWRQALCTCHNAKDLEKLIMPLLEKQSKPQLDKIIEAIQHKSILCRNMECQSE